MSRRASWLLVVSCVAQFMVILDTSIVNVALPSIQSSLGFSAIELQWVVDAYAILFAGFLMLGGRATDLFGPRRVFLGSLVLFAAASLAGGVAVTREMLVIARGAQGFAGAFMAASSLAIVTSSFPAGPARNRAIGLWGAMNGVGGAAGTLFGGILTEGIGWRWVLLVNPPIAVATAVVAAGVVFDRTREGDRAGFDLLGALSLTGGLVLLVYGIVDAGALGWGALQALVPMVVGAGLLALFPLIELRYAAAPLVPLRSLTRSMRTANGVVLLFSAALFPMWYVGSLYLQQVLGLTPLATGLVFLPMALSIMVAASRTPGLVHRFGLRPVLAGGLTMMAGGLLLLARIGASGSAVGYVMVPGILTVSGIGLAVVTSTIAATHGAGHDQAGLASGLVNTSRQVGGALGIALLVSLATEETSHLIGTGAAAPVALADGFRLAYLIGAGFCALAAALAVLRLPRPAGLSNPRAARLAVPAVLVLVAGFAGLNLATTASPAAPIGAYTTAGSYSYVSAPGLHPPRIRAVVDPSPSKLAPGYFLLANFYDLTTTPMDGQSGPLLLGNNLQPVWFKPVPKDVVASNLSEQTYEGRPVLTWWQGVVTPTGAIESGEYVVVDQHYRVVATLKGAKGWILTLHALDLVGNDAWVTANKDIPMNLTRFGGAPNGALDDSAVQEYDLATGKLVRSWDALHHIRLHDSYATPPTNGFPWDAYHVNAIDVVGPHTLLVSMRNTWAAYEINTRTGKILWTLGGKDSTFRLGPGADFQWQHDVSQSGSTITMFDDACCDITGAGTYLAPNGPSRGLVLRLDARTRTATLEAQFLHGEHFDAAYMGSLERRSDGNVVVGWGAQPYFSEYSSNGKLLLDAELPGPDLSYRATEISHWTGLPLGPPRGAVRAVGGKTVVYASWNGATEVSAWRVLAGASANRLHLVATTPKSGFESSIRVAARAPLYRVEALDASGRVIGRSGLLRPRG